MNGAAVMLETLQRAWRRWVDLRTPARTPPSARARFRLIYGPLTIGILSVEGGHWKFRYADEFRQRKDLRPLVQFPDVDRTYQSTELWPFFGLRIPSLKQPAVRAAVAREHIDEKDKV